MLSREQTIARGKERKRKLEAVEFAAQNPRPLVVDSEDIRRRNDIARELLSYYEFLTSMYLPDEALKRSPEGGWDWINAERLAFLGKTDVVVDLLKHIPYISSDGSHGEEFQIDQKCICIDYTGREFKYGKYQSQSGAQDPPEFFENADDDEPTWSRLSEPQHVVTLAKPESSTGPYILLDVRDGKAAFAVARDYQDAVSSWEFDSLKDLFNENRANFRTLSTVPLDPSSMMESWVPEATATRIKDAYHKHGWFSVAYDKAACMREVQQIYETWWESDRH